MERLPLSKLSLELRNEIYSLILVRDLPVHIHPAEDQKDVWVFTECTPSDLSPELDCLCGQPTTQDMDIAFFSVSRQVQQEAMTVLFGRNVIELHPNHPFNLDDFTQVFTGRRQYIRSMNVRCSSWPDELSDVEARWLRRFCSSLSMLRRFSVVLQAFKRPYHETFWVEEMLNYFHIMSVLPLEEATVKAIVGSNDVGVGQIPASVIQIIEQRATSLLLRDARLPPEPLDPSPATMLAKKKDPGIIKDSQQSSLARGRLYIARG